MNISLCEQVLEIASLVKQREFASSGSGGSCWPYTGFFQQIYKTTSNCNSHMQRQLKTINYIAHKMATLLMLFNRSVRHSYYLEQWVHDRVFN